MFPTIIWYYDTSERLKEGERRGIICKKHVFLLEYDSYIDIIVFDDKIKENTQSVIWKGRESSSSEMILEVDSAKGHT